MTFLAAMSFSAIGFALGVVVTVLFGRRVATIAVADAKAVAFDAGRVVNDASSKLRASMSAMELRVHAKLDALKADADKAAQDVANRL